MARQPIINGKVVERSYEDYREDRYLVNRRYQRKLVWELQEKQAFIDSLANGFPVPLFLFAKSTYKGTDRNEIFDGMLCISLDRSELGDRRLKDRVARMIKYREPYSTIIQADGIAMSGNDDEYGTTLQAVATAQLFQDSKLPLYIMMSGGTNTKSTELAKLCGVRPHCVAIGSYARKIVKKYLQLDDIYQNKQAMAEAVEIAKSLIDVSLENMKDD